MSDLPSLQTQFVQTIEAAKDLEALDEIRVRALGKKGEISALLSKLGAMAPEERKAYGQSVNQVKQAVQAALDTKRQSLDSEALAQKLASQTSDVTLPVRSHGFLDGRIHPISKVTEEIMEIFASLGFALAEGPDIETDSNNFTKLNIPPSHPARQDHDTFYLNADGDGNRPVLRTHTSPVQIRTMEAQDPPIRIIAPGRVYRSDSDQTHTPMFHQVEGLVIEEGIHMGHLKWTLEAFCKAFFEVDRVKMRFRASHFPFTEPSVEVDIGYEKRGSEIIIGEGDEWLEVLGCGMVHPNVLKNVGLDAEKLQGFAFGMGIDRLTMLKYGMPDLRPFFSADLEWLRHYGFGVLDIPTMQGGL